MAPSIDLIAATEKSTCTTVQVSDTELRRYARLVYDRLGIRLSAKKKTLLSNRITRRLRETPCTTFGEYLQYLERLEPEHAEWDAFIQEITTHETSLFREERHWEWFREEFLAEKKRAARRRGAAGSLRIWSAACSTGEEPYTIAACIAGTLLDFRDWRIQIIGSDVAVGALERAKRGEFNENSMRQTPDRFRRFFKKSRGGKVWHPDPALRRMVSFRRHNLLETPKFGRFDLALVKNVLIYFDGDSRKRAIAAVCSALKPGGFLLTGSAEGIGEWAPKCERVRAWLARIPDDPRHHADTDDRPVVVDPSWDRTLDASNAEEFTDQ